MNEVYLHRHEERVIPGIFVTELCPKNFQLSTDKSEAK